MVHGFLPLIGLLVLLAIAAIVLQALRSSRGKGLQTFPYQKESALFSPAERSFLGVLERALDGQVRVMGKVNLADVIRVRSGVSGGARQSAFNRIQSKHLDFVVCDAKDLSVRFAIELDDQSHARPNRQSRDEFVDKALRAAGVPVFHFSAKRSYSIQEVQRTLSENAPSDGTSDRTLREKSEK